MTREEILLREYIEFADINGSETVNILPLTIVDIMQEYADQETQSLKAELEIVENYNDMLIRELTELKEKHKMDGMAAIAKLHEQANPLT